MTNYERIRLYNSQPFLLQGNEIRELSDGSVGLFAGEDTAKDLTVLKVPDQLVIYSFDEYPWWPIFSKTDKYYVQLAARLLYERFESTSNDFRTKYVQALPHEV